MSPCFHAVMAGCLDFMLISNYICWVISSWYVHVDLLLKLMKIALTTGL